MFCSQKRNVPETRAQPHVSLLSLSAGVRRRRNAVPVFHFCLVLQCHAWDVRNWWGFSGDLAWPHRARARYATNVAPQNSIHTGDELEFIANWVDELPYISMAIGLLNSGRIPIRLRCGWAFSLTCLLDTNEQGKYNIICFWMWNNFCECGLSQKI